jgi:hypothetical protein
VDGAPEHAGWVWGRATASTVRRSDAVMGVG